MIQTITMLDFAVTAAPLTLAALALLFFGRRHIYRQMDDYHAPYYYSRRITRARSSGAACYQRPGDSEPHAFGSNDWARQARLAGPVRCAGRVLRSFENILTVLAGRGKPVGFNALVEEIRTEKERRRDDEELPKSALRTVLTILQVVRLIDMNRDGFSLTELGREVDRRMTSHLQMRAAVRQHGRRDYSVAPPGAPSSPLRRVSAARR